MQTQSSQPQIVDPQTFQASTAGELTYGKDRARDMLKLKRSSNNDQADTGLAHPQDVSGVLSCSNTAFCGQMFHLNISTSWIPAIYVHVQSLKTCVLSIKTS